MSREALVLLVCCCDFRDRAERLIPSKSLRNAVIWAFPGLLCILRMCAPRRAAAVVRPRGREKSADRRRRILISRLLIIRASVPRRKSPFPAYFKGFPAVSPLIPPYPTFLKYPVSPQYELLHKTPMYLIDRLGLTFDFSATQKITYATTVANIEGRIDADYYSPKFSHFRSQIEALPYRTVSVDDISEKIVSGFAAGKQDQADNLPEDQRVPHLRPFSITPEGELSFETKKYVPKSRLKSEDYCKKNEVIFNNTNSPDLVGKTTVFDSDVLCAASNHMTRITVKEGVNPYYVAAFFNVLLSIGYWKLLCTNFNNQAGVNTDTLKRVKIPLPPKEIQDQIAAELMQRRSQANVLRRQAIKEWADAKAQFEKELLGE